MDNYLLVGVRPGMRVLTTVDVFCGAVCSIWNCKICDSLWSPFANKNCYLRLDRGWVCNFVLCVR